jgi:ligand-binding sensor domain-containing protein
LNNRLYILALFLLAADALCGQSWYFRHFQVENGLSNNAVICSLKAKKGFLWFGTKDGLDRFDGYSFKIFRSDPDDSGSIGGNFIHSLYEDPTGVLWVGTEKGLYQHDATTESFSVLPEAPPGEIRDIQMDAAGNLWFISGFTLFKYTTAKKK